MKGINSQIEVERDEEEEELTKSSRASLTALTSRTATRGMKVVRGVSDEI